LLFEYSADQSPSIYFIHVENPLFRLNYMVRFEWILAIIFLYTII
jgi:hypothetical protein